MPASQLLESSRHLVLHFDINMSIVMIDSVSGKSMRDVANRVMAACGWGRSGSASGSSAAGGAAGAPTWTLAHTEPSVHRPAEDLVSYCEWVEEIHAGQKNKEIRDALWSRFTEAGEPGEAFASHRDAFLAALRLPDNIVGTEAAKLAGLNGDSVFIIPAFFELLLHLKRSGQSFTLVFRTFGMDLGGVVREFNAFCEGKHPVYPEAVFDGRDGEADYRVDFGNPSCFGTFFRSEAINAVIWGTLDQPNLKDGLAYYEDKAKFPDLKIVDGSIAILYRELNRCTIKPCTLALRDYFPYWRSQGMGRDPHKTNGGKLMIFGRGDVGHPHHIFFDDNVTYSATRIVDARDLRFPEKNLWVQYLLPCHLVRCEPLESVTKTSYFIEHVDRMVSAYSERLRANKRLRELLWKAAREKITLTPAGTPRPGTADSYESYAMLTEARDRFDTAEVVRSRPGTAEDCSDTGRPRVYTNESELPMTGECLGLTTINSKLRTVAVQLRSSFMEEDVYDAWSKIRVHHRHASMSSQFEENRPTDHAAGDTPKARSGYKSDSDSSDFGSSVVSSHR